MLTAYRSTYSNGQGIATSMAANVTLEMANDYFLGHQFEMIEGKPLVTAIKVEKIKSTTQ